MKRVHDFHKDHNAYARFNKRVAVAVTNFVGSMTCAWLFCLLALTGLPNALAHGQFVQWFAQTFLQLVLLSIILVGQNIQTAASDARNEETLADAEYIKNQVNEHTDGGIKAILDRIDQALPGR